ncbi:unnamed protein product [Staurois parvus]|uniref:Ig-like domain-containing protein n=1 Tax=Staurois parvus TaxID=386267 RepID=A0ABN9EFD6_9NEOB|nr:unnamed protein product [Staurois parvus]
MVESGPGTVKPSETLELTCKVTGASLTYYSVEWVRQFPGKGLEWMGRIIHNGATYYAESLKGRITITRDTSKGEIYLKLNNANTDDSGIYRCARATVQ